MAAKQKKVDQLISKSREALLRPSPFEAERLALKAITMARQEQDYERMAGLMSFLTQNCCAGMPDECLDVMETALERCCSPTPKRKLARSKS